MAVSLGGVTEAFIECPYLLWCEVRGMGQARGGFRSVLRAASLKHVATL